MLIVGTSEHLEDLDREYTIGEDLSVTAVAVASSGPRVFALLDCVRIVRVDALELAPVAELATADAQSLAADGATLVVGREGAHLVTVDVASGRIAELASFDAVAGRDGWENPAGPTPDLRSLAVTRDGTWLVNVHVGGIWRSADRGATWSCVVPSETDVHEVVAGADGPVAAAAAGGFGWSRDDGLTWEWTSEGLSAPYCRAAALDGEAAFVTASTGPNTRDGRVYRARLGTGFEQCRAGLPESFPFNVDTGCLAAHGGEVAFGTRDGRVFRSSDGGATFALVAERMRPVQAVRFV
jgi:hypothetical protein